LEELTRDAITELLSTKQPKAPAITIYVPTHRAASPPHMTEDQIRFKNLMHKAMEILKNRDDGHELLQVVEERMNQLQEDRSFWESQTEGLLICIRPGVFRMFHLPVDTEEYVAVADYFHLAPIFGVLQDMQGYYVLAIGQHNPALYKGNLYELQATDMHLPETLEAGLNIDEMNAKTENQGSARGGSLNPSSFNGRGGAKNPAEEDRMRFWRMIDQIVTSKADTKLPLILAGVESEVVEYRGISKYPKILETAIHGSFGGLQANDLLQPALEIVRKELLNPMHDDVIAEYKRAKGQAPELAAHDIAAIADAAEKGRIDKLLLADIRYTTDTVRDNSGPVPVLTFPPEESAQAVQDIAHQVWNTSGQIVDIEVAHMPEPGALILATLRY
jgi:hypothetical protein